MKLIIIMDEASEIPEAIYSSVVEAIRAGDPKVLVAALPSIYAEALKKPAPVKAVVHTPAPAARELKRVCIRCLDFMPIGAFARTNRYRGGFAPYCIQCWDRCEKKSNGWAIETSRDTAVRLAKHYIRACTLTKVNMDFEKLSTQWVSWLEPETLRRFVQMVELEVGLETGKIPSGQEIADAMLSGPKGHGPANKSSMS